MIADSDKKIVDMFSPKAETIYNDFMKGVEKVE